MKTLSSIHFGSPSVPVYFKFLDHQGYACILWAFLSQCGEDDFDLWLGINHDDPDLILRGLPEMDAFTNWLRALPIYPQFNCRPGTSVRNTRPDLADEYKNAEHLTIACTVGKDHEGRKVYALTHQLERPSAAMAFTHWPCTASAALADALLPLIEAIRGGNIDIRPAFNPLDTED